MSDSLSAIYDNMQDYKRRCERYREKARYNERGNLDCYSDHSNYVAALEVWENVRSGLWDACNWCGQVTEFNTQDLDRKLDSLLPNARDTKMPETVGKSVTVKSMPAQAVIKNERFSLLELD